MIHLQEINKQYGTFHAIQNVSLHIRPGEIYGLIGPSGAGKSTLLRLINLLEHPTSGEVRINGQSLQACTPKQLREQRKKMGMIFQQFNLLLNKTVFENVAIALQLAKYPKKQIATRVMQCLQFVGLQHFADKYPATLSGGQKQRVAIARALANEPHILLCDEPTSALDVATTQEILTVLQSINEKLGVTIVIVSHELNVVKSICHRVTVLADGKEFETLEIQPTGIVPIDQHPQTFVSALKEVHKNA